MAEPCILPAAGLNREKFLAFFLHPLDTDERFFEGFHRVDFCPVHSNDAVVLLRKFQGGNVRIRVDFAYHHRLFHRFCFRHVLEEPHALTYWHVLT